MSPRVLFTGEEFLKYNETDEEYYACHASGRAATPEWHRDSGKEMPSWQRASTRQLGDDADIDYDSDGSAPEW